MMKRIFLTAVISLVALFPAPAQDLTPEQMKQTIFESGSLISSIDCEFVQTKTMSLLEEKLVSTGRMIYRKPDELMWGYTTPVSYSFHMKGSSVTLERDGNIESFDLKDNKMIKEIARLIMGSIAGSNINDANTFSTSVEAVGREWVVTLVPKRKDALRMWSSLRLHYRPDMRCATSIEMNEPSGDLTVIEFKNIKTEFK